MSLVKYRVREVAKDLGMQPKEIAEIMANYTAAPKNNMQVMTDQELAIVFERLTQTHQVESIESIFADVYHEPKSAQAPAAPAAGAKPQNNKQPAQNPSAAQPIG